MKYQVICVKNKKEERVICECETRHEAYDKIDKIVSDKQSPLFFQEQPLYYVKLVSGEIK